MPDVISNTSCLIVLDNIDMLYILKNLYGEISITEEVAGEFGKELPEWIKVNKVSDRKSLKIISSFVDTGEASTIALSIEKTNAVMILDDLKARKLAKSLDLKFTGTIGLIVKAKNNGIIKDVSDVVNKLKRAGFRISSVIEERVLKEKWDASE
jgi:predicted nucleic acid-binding protein